jgi:hypothetical protein
VRREIKTKIQLGLATLVEKTNGTTNVYDVSIASICGDKIVRVVYNWMQNTLITALPPPKEGDDD